MLTSVTVLQALFFFLPAYVANMSPVFWVKWNILPCLKRPVDLNYKFGGELLFGEHKTYRGMLAGALTGILIGFSQALLFQFFPHSHWLFLFDYSFFSATLLGFLLGFGALLGDLLKSFFKRRLRIASGKPFFPFDQLDFVAGGLLLSSLLYFPSWTHIGILILLTPLLHFLVNVIGYALKLKKVWW